jgi:hypothetical protein
MKPLTEDGTASSGRNMKDLLHVAIGGGGRLLRILAF